MQMFTGDRRRGAQQSLRAVSRHQNASAPYRAIGNALHDALWLLASSPTVKKTTKNNVMFCVYAKNIFI
jgi:hypothetical protein